MTLGVAAGVAVVPVGVTAMSAFCSKRFWDRKQKYIKIQKKKQKEEKKTRQRSYLAGGLGGWAKPKCSK